jgi:hypothetical protein
MMQSNNFVFATLEPSNLQAKLDFDYLAERLSNQEQDGIGASRRYIHIHPQQEYNPEIYLFRRRQSFQVNPDAISATSTEVDTDSDDDLRDFGMIWTGHYQLDLTKPPEDPILGWIAGRGDPEKKVEIFLGLESKQNDIRGRHIIFNFHHKDTGFISILSRASSAGRYQVAVNGQSVPRGKTYSLNQNPMTIRVGTLEYMFRYTNFAREEIFNRQRKQHLNRYLGISAPILELTATPTGQARTFGAWTIVNPLGKGTFGKVHSATDRQGRVAAIKVVDQIRSRDEVQNEIQVLQELTALAETEDTQGRLLRLIEVIYSNSHERIASVPFDEVAIVLQPCVQGNFEQLTIARLGRQKYIDAHLLSQELA